jgi:hypothetical protein
MISDLINKIRQKSKLLKFESSRNYRSNAKSEVPYEELIVLNSEYPDFIFLVHKNMIFDRNSISDSSYTVLSFDKDGNFVKKEQDLDIDFFTNMKVVKKL